MWVSQHLELNPRTGKLQIPDDVESKDDYYDDDDVIEVQDIISTPFGLWRINDDMNPLKQFKLWMAHTNFNLGKKAIKTIVNVPGVEVLYVMTRYRFVIGVGELFDFRQVRIDITKKLCGSSFLINSIEDLETRNKVKNIKENIEKNEKWAIYVFPNGSIEYTSSEDPEYCKNIKTLKQAHKLSNGILIESDNICQ